MSDGENRGEVIFLKSQLIQRLSLRFLESHELPWGRCHEWKAYLFLVFPSDSFCPVGNWKPLEMVPSATGSSVGW